MLSYYTRTCEALIPVRAGPGLVIEQSPGPGGAVLELLRSRAVVFNSTTVPLEVALAFPAHGGAAAGAALAGVAVEKPEFGAGVRVYGMRACVCVCLRW